MEIVTSVPVRFNRLESTHALLEPVKERIAQLAYAKYIDRGSIDGYGMEDWLNAERELIVVPETQSRYTTADVFIDIIMPEFALSLVSLHVSPRQIVVTSSEPDRSGRQIFKVIDLPIPISMDGIDAERLPGRIGIVAALAEPQNLDRTSS